MIPYTSYRIAFKNEFFGIGIEPIMYMIGFTVFFFLIYNDFKKEKDLNFNFKKTLLFLIGLVVAINLGGRLWFYTVPWRGWDWALKFFYHPYSNMTTIGSIIGAVMYLLLFLKFNNFSEIKFRKSIDILGLNGAVLLFILRIGCYLDGHIKGDVTRVFWCIEKFGACRHPVGLYYSVIALIIFITLKYFFSFNNDSIIKTKFHGQVGILFLIFYSLDRILIDFFLFFNGVGLSLMQIVFIISLIFGVLAYLDNYLFYNKRTKRLFLHKY